MPPSESIVAPKVALVFVIELAVGSDKEGAAPAVDDPDAVGALVVR